MTIIDAHIHLGESATLGSISEKELITTMNNNNVQAAVVQPFPDAHPVEAAHDRIAKLAQQYPGRIFGLASVNTHVDKSEYMKEIRRCIIELGFVGVKFHPFAYYTSPLSEQATKVFEIALELKVPVMVHTGVGIPYSLPCLCLPRAKQFPEVKIVIAHCGKIMLFPESIVLARECPNTYFETSWVRSMDNNCLIKEATAQRVMFGSDVPENQAVEIAKYDKLKITEEQRKQCLSQVAIEVFRLRNRIMK